MKLAEHEKTAKRLIGDLILAAKVACPYVPDTVAAPEGGTLPVGLDLTRAVKEIQGFQAVTGEKR
jgi:hypothetical protein